MRTDQLLGPLDMIPFASKDNDDTMGRRGPWRALRRDLRPAGAYLRSSTPHLDVDSGLSSSRMPSMP